LAFQWIPASLSPRIKAIVVDLDCTLYEGVLGEDGIDGINLSPACLELQTELLRLKESGMFLAIASRNEQTDVEDLLHHRQDFPLKLEDFAAIQVNWQDKAENIVKIAESLRIGIDSILFIDDNPGELAKVSERLPGIWTILASNQLPTVDILKLYPRLWAWEKTYDDNLRLADLNASAVRDSLIKKSDNIEEYWQALQVEMDIHLNPIDRLKRLCELSQKTNQFNLALSRINEVEMSDYLAREDYIVASIHLRDRLSDSGNIGLIIGQKINDSLVIQEICISCRALGRHLEDIMIGCVLRMMVDIFSTKDIIFKYRRAPRNQPSLDWLKQFAKTQLFDDNEDLGNIMIANDWIGFPNSDRLSAVKINICTH
jgi:FkbH-like protein